MIFAYVYIELYIVENIYRIKYASLFFVKKYVNLQ